MKNDGYYYSKGSSFPKQRMVSSDTQWRELVDEAQAFAARAQEHKASADAAHTEEATALYRAEELRNLQWSIATSLLALNYREG